MIVQVIPLIKVPRHLNFFDYLVPEYLVPDIKIGQLIKIPWRSQVVFGLVKKIVEQPTKSGIKLKEIKAIVNNQPITTSKQVSFIEALTTMYHQSESLFWKMILPNIPTRKTHYKPWFVKELLCSNKKISQSKDLIKKNKSDCGQVLILPHTLEHLYQIAYELAKSKQRVLVICPEILHIKNFLKLFPENYFSNIAVLHKELSRSEYWQEYKKILDNKAKIIIGTRLSVFLPWSELDQVVILKSEDYSLKQTDQNPRFATSDITSLFVKIFNTQVVSLSLAPKLETYAVNKLKGNCLVNMQSPLNVSIIDIAKSWQANSDSIITFELEKAIANTLKDKRKIFLLVNKKGLASKIKCNDCKTTIKCNKCQNLLIPESHKITYCPKCQTRESFPNNCSHCHGVNFAFKGLTNQSIIGQLNKLFPFAKLNYLDANNTDYDDSADIVVGTEYAYQRITVEKFKLIGIVLADQLSRPDDYRASELRFQLLTNIIRLRKNITILIQTFNTELNYLLYIKSADYHAWWNEEMNWRKKLKYPPYSKLLKISYADKIEKKAITAINSLYQKIANINSIDIFEPVQSKTKINNKFVFSILIRYQKSDQLKPVLKHTPDTFILDFNPFYVF